MHSKILSKKSGRDISLYGKYVYFRVNILCVGEFHLASLCMFTPHTGLVICAKVVKMLQNCTVKILYRLCSAMTAKETQAVISCMV